MGERFGNVGGAFGGYAAGHADFDGRVGVYGFAGCGFGTFADFGTFAVEDGRGLLGGGVLLRRCGNRWPIPGISRRTR